MIKGQKASSVIISSVFVLYLFSIVSFGDRTDYYLVSNMIFVVFIIFMMISLIVGKTVIVPRATTMLLPFVAFSAISVFWSYDRSTTITRTITLAELFIMMFVMCLYLIKTKDVHYFLRGFVFAGFLVVLYVVSFYGVSGLRQLLNEETRVGTDIVNANTLAIYLSVSATICFALYIRKRKIILLAALLFFVLIIALTGSKKGIIDLVVGLLMTFLLFGENEGTKRKVTKMIFGMGVLALLFYVIWQLPVFNIVRERFARMFSFLFSNSGVIDYSTRERQQLLSYGIKQFFETPIVGIGIGATGVVSQNAIGQNTYLHNNYVELLASGGIVGFLLYYVPFLRMFWMSMKKRWSNDNARFCIILITVFLINDFAAVQFFSKLTFILFAIVISVLTTDSPSFIDGKYAPSENNERVL